MSNKMINDLVDIASIIGHLTVLGFALYFATRAYETPNDQALEQIRLLCWAILCFAFESVGSRGAEECQRR